MIGVCIKYFHDNYGGMLQAFATTKMLEQRGIQYELIRYKKKETYAFMVKSIPRLFNVVLLKDKYEALRKRIGLRIHPEFLKNDAIRTKEFKKFEKKNFTRLSVIYYGYDALCAGAKKYSAVVTGSDQLWSPAGLPTNYYNLRFVPDDIRKISYASSFGVKQIPWYQKRRTADFLKRIDYISMREYRGSDIVKELIGKEVLTILDPVFMFNEDDWKNLIPTKEEMDIPYIFAYFLGSNPKHRDAVKGLSKKTGLKIISLRHLDQYVKTDEGFGDFSPYNVSPEKFLNLLRGATYICTDSYHGTCFSIINRKQFMVFNRYNESSKYSKNSRIDTLCKNLGLDNRRFNGSNLEFIFDAIDYKNINEKIDTLRKVANQYLDKAFDGID